MAVEKLRTEVAVVTDWRGQLRKNQKNVLIGAAVAGFVLGGGIAAIGGLLRRAEVAAAVGVASRRPARRRLNVNGGW